VASVAWPPAYRAWAREHGLLEERAQAASSSHDREEPASRTSVHAVSSPARTLRIANPPDGATYLKAPTLRDAFQPLPLRAEAESGPLTWTVDGVVVGSGTPERALEWPLHLGSHAIAVTDPQGRRAE